MGFAQTHQGILPWTPKFSLWFSQRVARNIDEPWWGVGQSPTVFSQNHSPKAPPEPVSVIRCSRAALTPDGRSGSRLVMKRKPITMLFLFATACTTAPAAGPTARPVPSVDESAAAVPIVTGTRGDVVWQASAATLRRIAPPGQTVELPSGAEVSGIEVGYEGTIFASDRSAGRIYAVREGVAKAIAEGIPTPGPMVLYGSRLIVGAADGLYAVSLKTDQPLPDGSPDWAVLRPHERLIETAPVVGLALDHVGYFVVRTTDPPQLLRIADLQHVSELDLPIAGAGPIGFDEETRTLEVDGTTHDYVTLVGEDPDVWKERDARAMRPFETNGVILSGGEYWPNVGDQPTKYPDDVLWGFYPEEGVVFEGEASPATPTPAATACAEIAYGRLQEWVASAPPEFFEAVRRGTSNRFYLWVNDYSQADDPFPKPMRMNKFWYWERKPAVIGRVPGYWKWESTVTQKGECLTPDPAQIEEYLTEKIQDLPALTQ